MKILFQLAATFFSYYTYDFEKAKNEKKSIFLYYLAKQGSFLCIFPHFPEKKINKLMKFDENSFPTCCNIF